MGVNVYHALRKDSHQSQISTIKNRFQFRSAFASKSNLFSFIEQRDWRRAFRDAHPTFDPTPGVEKPLWIVLLFDSYAFIRHY